MTSILGEDFVWPLWQLTSTDAGNDDIVFRDPTTALIDRRIADLVHPRLLGYRPQHPNGGAVLIIAGGGYTELKIGKEGVEVAHWLSSLGFHAFVLLHRLPSSRFTSEACGGEQAPVDDALEAMRMIRARAGEFGVDASFIGAVGLSSGGHLAACLVAHYPEHWRTPASPYASTSARPDFLVVGYGPISTNASGRTVIENKPALLPPEKQALYEAMQPDVHMMDAPPPTFIVYSADDPVVPVDNAYRLDGALRSRGGTTELHVFSSAPHGFALRETGLPVGIWPQLCSVWLDQQGFLQRQA